MSKTTNKKTITNSDGFTMPDRDGRPYKVHVVSGSHWDREWRFTAVQSKLRLGDLIDDLLNILDENPDYHCYHVDGGAIVLEDYMSIRPENKERIQKFIKEGRISLSNWYTLPETNIVSPEALIRNLLVGKRVAAEFGGSMKAGYTATGYGQPSQLPQIYRGFGIDNALFYRGTNKHQTPPVCQWEGRDGSQLLLVRGFDETTRTNWFFYAYQPLALNKSPRDLSYKYNAEDHPVHMADDTLYNMGFTILNEKFELNTDKNHLMKGYEPFRDQAYKYAIGNQVLGMDMEDNIYPWAPLPKLIAALNEVLDDTEIKQSSMDEMFEAIAEEVKDVDLHVEKGELRYAGIEAGFNGLLGMTQSSRMKIKILNDECETSLITIAEPLSSIAAALGNKYPRVHLDEAWTGLLQNHSHDSICGAAVDKAHEDMLNNFSECKTISDEVAKRSSQGIWKHIDYSSIAKDGQVVTVFNVLPFDRKGVYQLIIDLPVDGSKEGFNMGLPSTNSFLRQNFDLVDEAGENIDFEVLGCEGMSMGAEINADANVDFPVERNRVLVNMDLPAFGYKSLAIKEREPRIVEKPKPGPERNLIAQPGGILENDNIKVSINQNGTFNLLDKHSEREFKSCNYFDDRGSTGNAHLDNKPLRDYAVTSLGCSSVITMLESNAMRGIYRIDLSFPIPSYCPGADRAPDMVEMPISIWLTLRKGENRLDVKTRIDNKAKDHRLAVMFPTCMRTETIDVETAFAVENRNFMWKDTGENFEAHYANQPMLSFADISDDDSGIAFLNKGMREYTMHDDTERTIGLTLIRTHRAYMTAAGTLTPDEKDNYPGLQCPGLQEFNYAICPHKGDWLAGKIMQESQDFRASVRAIQGPAKKGTLPPTQSLIKVEEEGKIMISAFCQSEDGKDTILRLWNITDDKVDTKITTTLPFKEAIISDMAEENEIETVQIKKGIISLSFGPAQIITLRLK